ncbi:MAG TPA: hypothetical protein VMV33_17135 [Rhodocyclaceae bacterium]|nr:hypothetical protein [Rhodocyclaceae bacterium]
MKWEGFTGRQEVVASGAGGRPVPVVSAAGQFVLTYQLSLGTSASEIAYDSSGRVSLTVVNMGSVDVFLGPSGVSATDGILLVGTRGASITIATTGGGFRCGRSGVADRVGAGYQFMSGNPCAFRRSGVAR